MILFLNVLMLTCTYVQSIHLDDVGCSYIQRYWETDADKGGGTASHEYKVVAPSDTAGVERGLASSSPLEKTVAQVYDALGALCGVSESRVYTFQMARYTKGHFIEPHDDTAYIELDDTPGHKWTRDIALIYYLVRFFFFNVHIL